MGKTRRKRRGRQHQHRGNTRARSRAEADRLHHACVASPHAQRCEEKTRRSCEDEEAQRIDPTTRTLPSRCPQQQAVSPKQSWSARAAYVVSRSTLVDHTLNLFGSNQVSRSAGTSEASASNEDESTEGMSCSDTDSLISKLSSASDSDSGWNLPIRIRSKSLLLQILQANNRRILHQILTELTCQTPSDRRNKSCAGGSSTHQARSELSGPSRLAEAKGGPKRKRQQERPSGDSDEDEDDRRPTNQPTRAKTKDSLTNRFACPFYQNNRSLYMLQRSCCGPGWPSIHRVK